MTEHGKASTHAHANLTEDAFAPSHSEGNPRLPPCGNEWCPTPRWCSYADDARLIPITERLIGYYTTELNSVALQRAVERLARMQAQQEAHDRACEARAKAALERTNRANAKSKLGPWEFTLTYSPRKHGWSRDEAQDAMRTAIERLTRYYREEIEEFHATGEWNASGDPHVHAWYRMDGGRKITTKSFVRAYPIWNPKFKTGPRGHEGGHHEPVKRTADFAGYIEKDLQTAWLKVDITNALPQDTSGSEADDDAQPSVDATPHSPHPTG